MLRACLTSLLILALAVPCAPARPYGLNERTTNTQLIFTDLPEDALGPMRLQRVFSQLSFEKSVLLVDPDDGTGRFFVLSQKGLVYAFPNVDDPAPDDVEVFLDIRDKVLDEGEQGLLGLAFEPDFPRNGRFLVYYSAEDPRRSVVARYTAPDPARGPADRNTEEVVLTVAQPYSNHNGGMIAFGPDDRLYIGLGDGGSGGDPLNSGQDTTTLLGAILRIDVLGAPDPGLQYAIPPDNPFAGGGGPSPESRGEIYAYGLRNPYRFSFDMVNDYLFCGDVGQNAWEEIDVIVSGGNYGWNIMEGDHCYPPNVTDCDRTGLIPPIAEYSHTSNGGRGSVTGGYVYYGDAAPDLYGVYVFADYMSQRIFGVRYDGQAASPMTTLVESGLTVTGFGQDATGEVYVLDYFGGIYVLRERASSPNDFPTRLSDHPALFAVGSGRGETVDGVFPYEPSAKLWSDGALKERYFALADAEFPPPDFGQIGFRFAGGWDFPEGSVLAKNFLLPMDFRDPAGTAKRIESRYLIKRDGVWRGFTFEWNEEETDATLLPYGRRRAFTPIDQNGEPFDYEWEYPSRSQCMQCHTRAANFALGLDTPQMNRDFAYPRAGVADNQLRALDHVSLFTARLPGPPDSLPAMPDSADESASLDDRARAYLAANCSMCHQPGGVGLNTLDLRWEVSNQSMNALDIEPTGGGLDAPNPAIIRPGAPESSVLLLRMETLNPAFRMPPLATSLVDAAAVELIAEWIRQGEFPVESAQWLLY